MRQRLPALRTRYGHNWTADGDGTQNGSDTQPLNPCVPGTGTPDPTNPIWAAADCDNDGETNGFEEHNNGTDPCRSVQLHERTDAFKVRRFAAVGSAGLRRRRNTQRQ
jgi:hypothetical protein